MNVETLDRHNFRAMVDNIRRGTQQISITKEHKIKYNYTYEEIQEDAEYWLKECLGISLTTEKAINTCAVRPDLLKEGERVPIGDNYYGKAIPLKYRWIDGTTAHDDIFQVWYLGKWQEAVSIDFEFID